MSPLFCESGWSRTLVQLELFDRHKIRPSFLHASARPPGVGGAAARRVCLLISRLGMSDDDHGDHPASEFVYIY